MNKCTLKQINIIYVVFMCIIISFSLCGCNTKSDDKDVISLRKDNMNVSNISAPLKEAYNSLELKDVDNVRGNLHLPLNGENGSSIIWTSSNTLVIQDSESLNDNYDNTPPGVVNRQDRDVEVLLTASITLEDETIEKDFLVTVREKYVLDNLTDYIFAYFTGNGKDQEAIYFSSSKDGFSYKELNNGRPVIQSELGTKGLRDPFIIRSDEGDKFYMIATDLCIANDGDWWKAQTNGSTSIMIWESDDLINWSDQRMIQVNSDMAGCTWAPEAFYDDITGEYLVFFASRVKSDNYSKQRIYYIKTRDFYTFSEPDIWIDYEFGTIDTTVVKDRDAYYRFTKYEEMSTIILERSDSLLGTWIRINSATLEEQEGVEGPSCYLLNDDDIYEGNRLSLLLDQYGGTGYYLMVTDSLDKAVFEKKRGYNLPKGKPRHGTVMAITSKEYQRIMENY